MSYIDFTNCQKILKAYNGANGKKIAIIYENEQYMLKFPPSAEKKPTDLSYTNSCISEHIGSTLFNMLGISAQQTLLGTFKVNNKEKIVCACKDFVTSGKVFYDFGSIKNTIIDSEHNGTGTELGEILETIEKQNFVDPIELKKHFWDMFVVDTLLGNFDRHNGNWGFLYDEKNNHTEIAPVFDCGSCLLPQADEETMKKVLNNQQELNARIYNFPSSIIRINGKKINYYDFLINNQNSDCEDSLKRIVPRIDIKEITDFIFSISYLSDLQKSFYSKYLNERYEKIISPAYEIALNNSYNYEPEPDDELEL